MVYKDFNDLPVRAASDKVSRDNAFIIASDPRYDMIDINVDVYKWLTNDLIYLNVQILIL